ncbi:alpha/beta hydrolase-fold protein [Sulfurospirillum halorespirans]|uniref:Esterase n=1 Tax=Sulfurospirillum halorespirans DSM 13726 TaxID=1193502 RepID=A0A1D7TMY3_9BACT|nr:alpha/beta hydrolase-fold protein [Sulfurospirillum halorespirans]AOO66284.1 esterase [Sulfurospirillum halorespirans DSM 13726]
MRFFAMLLCLCMDVFSATLPPQSPRLQALINHLEHGGTTQAFWEQMAVQQTPLMEEIGLENELLLTFLYRGARHNVYLFGAPSGEHDALYRLGASDVWYRSYVVDKRTRLSYQLSPDIKPNDDSPLAFRTALLENMQHDFLNPKMLSVKLGERDFIKSLVELPLAPKQPWIQERDVPKGTLEKHAFFSKTLNNTRDIYLYRSFGYKGGDAVVVLFDAESYASHVPTPTILDNLVAAKKLPPLAAILISNPSSATRSNELPPNPLFANFVAQEVMPWAKEQGIYAAASQTVITGSSYGGLASAYIALCYPEIFGNVYAQSGSFWWSPKEEKEPEWLSRTYAQRTREPIRFYLEAGLFEVSRVWKVGILESTRHFRDVLMDKGYEVSYAESYSGHDYAHWRGSLADGLITLLNPSLKEP